MVARKLQAVSEWTPASRWSCDTGKSGGPYTHASILAVSSPIVNCTVHRDPKVLS
jgi:hypothetical protein